MIWHFKNPFCLSLAVAAAVILFSGGGLPGQSADPLREAFVNPPEGTKPRCYWYWMKGNISKEGITRDLEAMKRVGIGAAYIGVIEGGGDIKALSDPWWEMLRHAVREGTRTGVDIGIFNCPGWSMSGGPWVKAEQAMRHLVSTETRVKGPVAFDDKLAEPGGEFQEVTTLAFPAPAGDADTIAGHSPRYTCVPAAEGVERLFDGDPATKTDLPGKPQLLIETPEPYTARSLTLQPWRAINVTCTLRASDDGTNFREIRSFKVDRHNLEANIGPVPLAAVTVSFPATTARFFRLDFSADAGLADITLSAAARVESYMDKKLAKMFQSPLPPHDFYSWPASGEPDDKATLIPADGVRDIGKNLKDGKLRWEVPAGDWVIQRLCLVPTGTKNGPAPPEATGYEVDKMNREALAAHFKAYVGKLADSLSPAERKSFKYVVADSYEMGSENWTDGFAGIFKERYGYDPLPYLPVMSGRVVGSADQSDRFLWDLRRLIADKVSHDYVGGLRDLCREKGLKMWLENYGHWGFPGEFLQYGGATEEIGGEFWESGDLGPVEVRCASSAAHIYGKRAVYAEAFTGGPFFISHPFSLKARGDWSFCQGINQFVLHVNIQQPNEDKPGIAAGFGTEFNRHNTWFEQGKAWMDYQRRCSVLLQAGNPVADVAYFIGEDSPKMTGAMDPALPAGYNYDFINAEVILNRVTMKDGRFTLPEGTSYRVMVLPPQTTMRPEVLAKIEELVKAGGVILGKPPEKSPSLQDYPGADARLREIAGRMWGEGTSWPEGRAAGSGKVFQGQRLEAVFTAMATPPDLSGVDHSKILHTHRSAAGEEIYFLSNQTGSAVSINPVFRVTGRVPELWHPESGAVDRLVVYEKKTGATSVPIRLEAYGSIFVIFREAPGAAVVFTGLEAPKSPVNLLSASYGPEGDLARTVDVRERVQRRLDLGVNSFNAGELAVEGDPAYGVVKTLKVIYQEDGRHFSASATDTGIICIGSGDPPTALTRGPDESIRLLAWRDGAHVLRTATGETRTVNVSDIPEPLELTGRWELTFPADSGVKSPLSMEALVPWNEHADPRVKYFSGTVSYRKEFQIPSNFKAPGKRVYLDLGQVGVMAEVIFNGKNLGTLWKPPFLVDLSPAVVNGPNRLEVRVVNVWKNRLVGQRVAPQAFAAPGNFVLVVSVGIPNYGAGESLVPSGLIGPVLLRGASVVLVPVAGE